VGPGVVTVPQETYYHVDIGRIDITGEQDEGAVIRPMRKAYVTLPIIYKDFFLHWRDIELSAQFGLPLETGAAAPAAMHAARTEDDLIFNGYPPLNQPGLLNVEGRRVLPMRDWDQMGAAFDDVVAAHQQLVEAGFYTPMALAVSPRRYANLHRVYANTAVLEIEQIQKLMRAGVYQTPVVPDDRAVAVATGEQNVDLAVAQDFITAFLESRNLNHYFRVLEVAALRIKRPDAVVTLEMAAAGEGQAGRGG
jgi:uncharacterized linocin/CFP29 family protein